MGRRVSINVARGTIVWLEPDPAPSVGHEQQGRRPAVIVSDEQMINSLRYSMIAAVPLTKTPGLPGFYPLLRARPGGLRVDSTALPDQLRSVDKRRVAGKIAMATASELAAVDASVRLFLKLP
jgi:mRNA interferase MazF